LERMGLFGSFIVRPGQLGERETRRRSAS
jgi:hypothetical protein